MVPTFSCRILTPKRTVYENDSVTLIEAQGMRGTFELLVKHEPIMSPLAIGLLLIQTISDEKTFAVHGGFIEMTGDEVTVLADVAEIADEIDLDRARESKKRAHDRLDLVSTTNADSVKIDTDRARLALLRAALRIRASGNQLEES